uniref:Uncharacterized protein n=2 Tax=Macaca TaxID=9539 RepID=A0A5F8A460_MACMU
MGPAQGPSAVCSLGLGALHPSTLAVTKRGKGTAKAMASEGGSPKPWQLPHGVEPVGAQTSRTEVWEPRPGFQRMYGNTWMPRQKLTTGVGPSWRSSARAVWKGNVGSEPPHRVPTGAPHTGAVRIGPPSSRPLNGISTDSLHLEPGKATDTQCQHMKAARRGAMSCKARGGELPKTMETHLLHQHDLDVRHRVKGDYFGALRSD